jgi:hypothetical protein
MEFKNSNLLKIRLILLDIFPSFEDLKKQYKEGLSIIFHGINMFYNLEELISQKQEIVLSPHQSKKKLMISIIKLTDILATGQLQVKQGTQWVTFLYENKEKPTQGNLALNLIDCIKINILVDILSENNLSKRNNSIEIPERKEIKNKLNKKSKDSFNFQKITKLHNIYKTAYHNNSQEHYNSEIIDNNLVNQTFSSITKEYNKKIDINNNLNNSINFLYKEFINNNNNIYSLKKLKSQNNTNINKKFKKRVNNSSMNHSGVESKTLNYSSNKNISNKKSYSKPKMNMKEEKNHFFSSTLKNFNTSNNRKNNFFYKKYLATSDNDNNSNCQNFDINIDELLTDKITEHINMVGGGNNNNIMKNNGLSGVIDNNKFKKLDNYNNNINRNKLIYSKTKPSNIINVNVKVNELYRAKNGKKKSKNKYKYNNVNKNINNQKNMTYTNPILFNKKNINKNILDLEISTNSIVDESDKQRKNLIKVNKEDKTISTKKNKKIIFNQENSSEPTTISIHKNNKSQCYTAYDKSIISDKSYDHINNNNNNDNEIECNNFNLIKKEFILVYNDNYIKNIQEDLLKLEIELFIEKMTELIKEYHKQIEIKNMEHELMKNYYKNYVNKYLLQWKLYNKLKYIEELHESKRKNIFEDRKQIDKNKINKININQKEINLFQILFNNKKEKYPIDIDEKKFFKNILLNVLGKCNNNILNLNLLQNDKYKTWIKYNIPNFDI